MKKDDRKEVGRMSGRERQSRRMGWWSEQDLGEAPTEAEICLCHTVLCDMGKLLALSDVQQAHLQRALPVSTSPCCCWDHVLCRHVQSDPGRISEEMEGSRAPVQQSACS